MIPLGPRLRGDDGEKQSSPRGRRSRSHKKPPAFCFPCVRERNTIVIPAKAGIQESQKTAGILIRMEFCIMRPRQLPFLQRCLALYQRNPHRIDRPRDM